MTGVNPALVAERGRPVSTLWTCNGLCCYPAVEGDAQTLGNVLARTITLDAIARHRDECPAGGPHQWVTLYGWEAWPGAPGTRCDECGALPPKEAA